MDFITALASRDLREIITSIFRHLSVPETLQSRLVCQQWQRVVETFVLPKKSFRKRELKHNLCKGKPLLVDLDHLNDASLETCLGVGDWDQLIAKSKEL